MSIQWPIQELGGHRQSTTALNNSKPIIVTFSAKVLQWHLHPVCIVTKQHGMSANRVTLQV